MLFNSIKILLSQLRNLTHNEKQLSLKKHNTQKQLFKCRQIINAFSSISLL